MLVIFPISRWNFTHSVDVVVNSSSLLQSWPYGLQFDLVTFVESCQNENKSKEAVTQFVTVELKVDLTKERLFSVS